LSREKAPSRGASEKQTSFITISLPQVVVNMEVVYKHVLKRKDGTLVNLHYEPVKSISKAQRVDEELFKTLMNGHYKPHNPDDFYMQPIRITYEEVTVDVQQIGDDRKDSNGSG